MMKYYLVIGLGLLITFACASHKRSEVGTYEGCQIKRYWEPNYVERPVAMYSVKAYQLHGPVQLDGQHVQRTSRLLDTLASHVLGQNGWTYGHYKNGLRDSSWMFVDDFGQTIVGKKFKDGLLHGKQFKLHNDDTTYVKTYIAGKLHGVFRTGFRRSTCWGGMFVRHLEFRGGKPHGRFLQLYNGDIYDDFYFKDGKLIKIVTLGGSENADYQIDEYGNGYVKLDHYALSYGLIGYIGFIKSDGTLLWDNVLEGDGWASGTIILNAGRIVPGNHEIVIFDDWLVKFNVAEDLKMTRDTTIRFQHTKDW